MADQTMRRGPGHILASLFGAAVAILVLLAAGSVQAATVTVAAMNFEFQPASRMVAVGGVVRWTFAGDPHTVTSGSPGALDGRFDSGIQNPGGSFQVTFDKIGTFPYFCQIHPEQMFGTIVVRAAAPPKPTVQTTPAPTPTPRPTARPTVRPTATPAPTPPATPTPTATPAPLAPTLTPVPSVSASTSPVASETAGPGAATPAGSVDPAPIVALLVVLGFLIGGSLIVARRRRVS